MTDEKILQWFAAVLMFAFILMCIMGAVGITLVLRYYS